MSKPAQIGLVRYNKGAYITIEGKKSEQFYIIRSGHVRVEKDFTSSDEQNVETLKPGDFFAVVATMSNHAHIDTAVALEEVVLIAVQEEQYSLLIERNNAVAMKIINGFSQEVRSLDESLTRLTFKSTAKIDQRHLFRVGEYYARQNQFNQAFYAYYKYCLHNPSGANVAVAKQRMAKIKPYAKVTNLTTHDSEQFIKSYPKNTMIFAEGESGPELYIIQKGSIGITKIVDDNEVLLALLKKGDIFGEMALLENKPRSASAIAHEDSVLMAVNRANFKSMVVEQPKIVARLTASLAERIWNLNRQLQNALMEDPVGRLYDSLVLDLEKGRLDLGLRQAHTFDFGPSELINMVGLNKEKGRLVIKKLLENGDLTVTNNHLYTSDITKIKKSADYYKRMQQVNKARHRK